MRYYDILAEETADDLYRKIAALTAVINDAAATDGEKENARRLKDRLEQRLQTDYPNQKSSQITDLENSWLGQMAKAVHDEEERKKYWAENPGAETAYWKRELERLKNQRADFYRSMIPGDVYNAGTMQEYNRRIDSILKKHFPEEWKAELAKREKKRASSYKAADKKRQAKDKELKKQVAAAKEKQGLGTFKEVGKEFEEPLKTFHKLLQGLRYPKWARLTVDKFKSGAKTLSTMNELATADLRNKWTQLPAEDQQAVVAAVSRVNELGYKGDGYTPAQKKRIIDALRPSKAKPSKYDDPEWYQKKLVQRAEKKRW